MHYYNEFDPQAAAWLQVLIDQHLIPEGVVDTRSIVEVTAEDLGDFVQCHFFAGIGGWPLALQLAGVPASTRLWTGSCPCQPFSVAGGGKGTADERHLWPVFFDLIRACNPPLVFGEQVASAAVLGSSAKPSKRGSGKTIQPVWLDGVFADLESASYACGSADIPAAGVGAPHIRQRCWWGAVRMADADGRNASAEREQCRGEQRFLAEGDGTRGMADTLQPGLEGHAGNVHNGNEPGWIGANQAGSVAEGSESGWQRVSFAADCLGGDEEEFGDECAICGLDYNDNCQCPGPTQDGYEYEERDGILYARRLGHTASGGLGIIGDASLAGSCGHADGSGVDSGMGDASEQRREEQRLLLRTEEPGRGKAGILEASGGGEVGFWNDSYWHPCRDGKHRRVPVEPGLFPLVDGLSYRVARRRTVRPPLLRGAGNAIVPEVAAEFVKAFYEVIES